MLWIIAPRIDSGNGTAELSPRVQADVDNLKKNALVSETLGREVVSSTRDEAGQPLGQALAAKEPIYVLAHAGFEKGKPWIGGMYFPAFAEKMAAKFGPGLSGRNVYFLVCYVGTEATRLAQEIANHVDNLKINVFVPTGLMFVSANGKPYVFRENLSVEKADGIIVKAGGAYEKLKDKVFPSGQGWAGAAVSYSTAEDMKAQTVQGTISGAFG